MSFRERLRHYVPAHFDDPIGLALRLIRSGDAAAMFAMAAAAGGVAATPLDAALSVVERRLLKSRHKTPTHPQIFVCGAPRAGTTVVYQTLASHLPVAHFTNLTALFPRSPLTAQRLFGRFVRQRRPEYHSFYGRTQGLGGTSDALFLWDRWLGADRTSAPAELTPKQRREMQEFFAACDAVFDRPLLAKNNSLNLSAHLVAECLPNARFLCVTRDRRQLARSLYRARCDIHGAPETPYGVAPPAEHSGDAVQSVCAQAAFYEDVNARQRERLGDERFWLVSYEEFCRNPGALVERVASEVLGNPRAMCNGTPKAFQPSTGDRVPPGVAQRIDAVLAGAT